MIIVNDNVFNADVSQPHIKHGTLNPATDFANQTLADMSVGTIYISKTGVTGQPCNTTVTAACVWVKEGTPGSPCSPAGSKSDWRRVGTCGGFLMGTTKITPGAAPWCAAERGDIYEQSVTGQTWKLYHIKAGNACDAPWINMSKGCVFEDTHTPVGSMDADLCALPVSSFVHVDNVGTFIKVKNNCDGNDWVPLQTDLSNVQDMRIVTSDPNDAALGKPTYDVATRTLNIPPRGIVVLRKDQAMSGNTSVNPSATTTINFDVKDIDKTQNNANAVTTDTIIIPYTGYYRFFLTATGIGKAAAYKWRVVLTLNGSLTQEGLWDIFPLALSTATNASSVFEGTVTGGSMIGMQLQNTDTTASEFASVQMSVEHLGT